LAARRAQAVEDVLKRAHARWACSEPLLAKVKREVTVGFVSYYVYLVSCLLTLAAASASNGLSSLGDPWLLAINAGRLVKNIITFQVTELLASLKHLLTSPALVGILALGFLLSYLLASFSDGRMRRVFSEFWFRAQQELRGALKGARQSLLETGNGNDKAAFKDHFGNSERKYPEPQDATSIL
jgi:hypothetical protein